MAGALEGAPLKPTQGNLSGPKVERFADAMKAGDEFPPIKLDGDHIVEGHHRYAASRVSGTEVATTPGGAVPETVKAADWSDVVVRPEDY